MTKAKQALRVMRRAIFKLEKFPIALIRKVLKVMVEPVITYGMGIWGEGGGAHG